MEGVEGVIGVAIDFEIYDCFFLCLPLTSNFAELEGVAQNFSCTRPLSKSHFVDSNDSKS